MITGWPAVAAAAMSVSQLVGMNLGTTFTSMASLRPERKPVLRLCL
jgi:hypothetical protein